MLERQPPEDFDGNIDRIANGIVVSGSFSISV
jgi:hypothetical protein